MTLAQMPCLLTPSARPAQGQGGLKQLGKEGDLAQFGRIREHDAQDFAGKSGRRVGRARVLDVGAGRNLRQGRIDGGQRADSGVISSGRLRFWAIDWVTRLVSARGRPGSAGLGGLDRGGAAARPRRDGAGAAPAGGSGRRCRARGGGTCCPRIGIENHDSIIDAQATAGAGRVAGRGFAPATRHAALEGRGANDRRN